MIALINLSSAEPEPVVMRSLDELLRSGGLSKRKRPLPPAFEPAMKAFLDVYNTWSEAGYKAMLTAGRPDITKGEQVELAGYKALHGACRGYSTRGVRSPLSAALTMDCERGSLEMSVDLGADGKIKGFSGTSRDVAAPPELRKLGERVAALVKRWDNGVYKKHLAHTPKPRDEAARLFDDLRSAHGACAVASLISRGGRKKLLLQCERGGDLELGLTIDAKTPDVIADYAIEPVDGGTCPRR